MATLNYNQISPILETMYKEYTGRTTATNIPFATMQQVFKTGLEQQDDNLYQLVPTLLAKTVYGVRPYSRKLKGMVWNEQRYGNYMRKFTPIVEGSNVDNDEWNINVELAKDATEQDWKAGTKPMKYDVLLTISAGGNTFARKYTIFKNQLNAAFDSAEGVASYFSMIMTEFSNIYEIDLENCARAQLSNLVVALADAGGSRLNAAGAKQAKTTGNCLKATQCFHALTQYNAETGLSMTAQTIMNPQDFRPFMIWLSAEMTTLKDKLGYRGTLYHGDVTGKVVNRQTPESEMRIYLSSKFANYFEANGAEMFHPDKATLGDFEKLAFWTDPQKPMSVVGSATVLNANGKDEVAINSAYVNNIIGLMFDMNTCGLVPVDQWSAMEPFNARFGFRNGWNHYTFKSPVDFTENAILILLD